MFRTDVIAATGAGTHAQLLLSPLAPERCQQARREGPMRLSIYPPHIAA